MIRSAVAFSLLINTTSLLADDLGAFDYLQQMTKAVQSLNYSGTMIYNAGNQVESMQIFHKSGPGGERERLIHLSGQPREVLRNNDIVTCYMPEIRSVTESRLSLGPTFANRFADNNPAIAANYSVKLNGEGRVAGMYARQLLITPKDNYRYGYRLWLAKDNSLLLKSELLDANGNTLEQVMFAQVEVVNTISEELLKTSIDSENFTWHRGANGDKKSDAESLPWRLITLPKGFQLTQSGHRNMQNSQNGADHLVVSDGLASVSVYIEAFGVDSQSIIGHSQFGALNVYGKILDDHKITVVGDVPETTVRIIADAVDPTK